MARTVELSGAEAEATRAGGREFAGALERYAVVCLVALALFGFSLRVAGVGEVGFAEDEINKLEAVRAYERGDLAVNAEHPMLMKALIFVSMRASREWNLRAPVALRLSTEAALRLPNILFGALTLLPIYLLTALLFDRPTGLLAAAFWATGVNAITFNRVAKEDTLLVFFMLTAFYFYARAKATSGFEPRLKRRNYVLSGAAFGMMLASKYFPHYFGLNMLYHHFARLRVREAGEPRGSTPLVFYVVVAAAFIVANPPLLLPETWAYLNAYSSEQLLTHHGYLMGETLYDNVMSKTPFGATPVYFYLLYLALKTPLPVVVALVCGLAAVARRWREPGPLFLVIMFALWIVPYSLAGAKWLRYTLSLMPFVYMLAAVGVVSCARAAIRAIRTDGGGRARLASLAAAALVALFVGVPAWAALRSRPHYALYVNALAPARAGYYFPHDEFYDAGLREAVRYVAARAPRGATVAHETPGVVRHYLGEFGRSDLRSRVISDPGFDVTTEGAPLFVLIQRGRTYFENRDEMEAVRRSARLRASAGGEEGDGGGAFTHAREILIEGASAVEIYTRGVDEGGSR